MAEEMETTQDTLKLQKPLADGRTELIFDFSKINGYALIKCEAVAKKLDRSIVVPSLSMVYQAHVTAAATGLRYDDVLSLSGTDFTAALLKTQSFLTGTGDQQETA